MSLSLLVQLATGNQQGRSQPDKECANDPSNGAHPPRVALAFGRQPRGAPDRRLSVAASGSAVVVMYTFGWPILMTEHGLEGGDVAINARLPGFALGAKLESVEASVPASRVAGRVLGAQLLGQNEDRASVGWFRERKADDVGAPGEGHSAGRVPLQHAAGRCPVGRSGARERCSHLPLVDLNTGGKPSSHLLWVGHRLPHQLHGPGQVTLKSQHGPATGHEKRRFVHNLFLDGCDSVTWSLSLSRLSRRIRQR